LNVGLNFRNRAELEMMRIRLPANTRNVLSVLTLILFLCATQFQGQSAPVIREPAGDWTIKLAPYAGPGHESMPLQVVRVKARVNNSSIWVIERRLLNRSDKPVVQASFDLFFYNEQEPDKLLFRRPIPTMSYVNAPILPGASFPTPAARKADPPRLQSFSIPSIKDLFTP
jgi:hypothetical protein